MSTEGRYLRHEHSMARLTKKQETDAVTDDVIDENTSDGFHTFKELYEMRLLLTANLFNEWADDTGEFGVTPPKPWVFKSKLHSDGTIPFNDPNWFIVVAETWAGQISFHYKRKDWGLFHRVPEVVMPPKYDGHTTADVAIRLRKLLAKENDV